MKSLSRVQLFVTPWTVAYHTPPSMGFSRQEYWSGLPFPSPGDLPDPRIEPGSPALYTDALPSEPPGKSFIRLKRGNRRSKRNQERMWSWKSRMGRLSKREYQQCLDVLEVKKDLDESKTE